MVENVTVDCAVEVQDARAFVDCAAVESRVPRPSSPGTPPAVSEATPFSEMLPERPATPSPTSFIMQGEPSSNASALLLANRRFPTSLIMQGEPSAKGFPLSTPEGYLISGHFVPKAFAFMLADNIPFLPCPFSR